MIPHALLARAQELPPPPETTGSPQIDTVRVIGVVLISLMVIVLLALAIRPFVVKPARSKRSSTGADEPLTPAPAPVPDPIPAPVSTPGAIIQFPKALVAEGVAGGPSWAESNATIAERFNRVVGEPGGRRRKLGDRNPRSSLDLATAAMNRVAPETRQRVLGSSGPVSPVSIHGGAFDEPTQLRPQEAPYHWAPTQFVPPTAVEPVAPSAVEAAPFAPAFVPSLQEMFDQEESPAQDGFELSEPELIEERLAPDPVDDGAELNASSLEQDVLEVVDAIAEPNPADEPIEVIAAEPDPVDEPEDLIAAETEPAALDVSVATAEPAAESTVLQTDGPVDTATLAALHQVVRDLIYCANAGELLQGFALYSDPYLFRFLDDSGMTETEFRDAYSQVKARPRALWDHLDLLSDMVVHDDGRISATASYVNGAGEPSNGLERYRFVAVDDVWMIDDIEPV